MGYEEDRALLAARPVRQMSKLDVVQAGQGHAMVRRGATKVVGEAWGGAAPAPLDKNGNPLQLPQPQQHVCAWKDCAAILPFPGFCEEHLAKVQTEEVGPDQLKASVGGGNPNRPSAKNLKLINQGQNGDDMLTADARDWARLARMTDTPGFEGPSSNAPVQSLIIKPQIRPAPIIGPDGQPISAPEPVAVEAYQAPPAPIPLPPPPAVPPSAAVIAAVPPPPPPAAPIGAASPLVSPAVVGGGGELRVAMSAYESLRTLSPEGQGRVLAQLAEMFGLRVVPSR